MVTIGRAGPQLQLKPQLTYTHTHTARMLLRAEILSRTQFQIRRNKPLQTGSISKRGMTRLHPLQQEGAHREFAQIQKKLLPDLGKLQLQLTASQLASIEFLTKSPTASANGVLQQTSLAWLLKHPNLQIKHSLNAN